MNEFGTGRQSRSRANPPVESVAEDDVWALDGHVWAPRPTRDSGSPQADRRPDGFDPLGVATYPEYTSTPPKRPRENGVYAASAARREFSAMASPPAPPVHSHRQSSRYAAPDPHEPTPETQWASAQGNGAVLSTRRESDQGWDEYLGLGGQDPGPNEPEQFPAQEWDARTMRRRNRGDSGDDGPGRDRHDRSGTRPRGRRVALVLVSVLLFVAGGAGFAYWRLSHNIKRVDISGMVGKNRPGAPVADADKGPLNVLIMGSDSREGEVNNQFGSTKEIPGARSDTTLLLHLSSDRKAATVVSIPRDSMLPLPRNCKSDEPKATWPTAQWNSAFEKGGPGCTVKAFEANTQIRVNHFVVVDFRGFEGMVSALGGVPVCLPKAIKDKKSDLDLPAGKQTLKGEDALGYVRVRYIGDGSDLSRIKRQQAFISSMIQKAMSEDLMSRPDKLLSFLDAATKALVADPEFGVTQMKNVATSIKGIGLKNISFMTIPVEPYIRDKERVQWSADANVIWSTIRADKPLGGPTPTPQPSPAQQLSVSPSEISLAVTNSSGVQGLASQTAAALQAQGFKNVTSANGDVKTTGTLIKYPKGREEAAKTVQAAFPGSTIQEIISGTGRGGRESISVQLGVGSPPVALLPNRIGQGPLPAQPISAGTAGSPTVDTRTAEDDLCQK